MSSIIWTRCAGDSELRALRLEPWRAVESQHQVSTRRLVDSDAEQRVLEDLIEGAKPPDRTRGRLHYLLATPFRYPPLPHGSRFGRRTDPGIWYGSESLRTVFAEVAYYRLVFLEGTGADLGAVETELTVFRAQVRTERGIDLAAPPFSAHEAVLASPVSYAGTQALGEAMDNGEIAIIAGFQGIGDMSLNGVTVVQYGGNTPLSQPGGARLEFCLAENGNLMVGSQVECDREASSAAADHQYVSLMFYFWLHLGTAD